MKNLKLSEYTEGMLDASINVKVKAQVEGVTNTIYTGTHTKTETETNFTDFSVDVNGFTSAKLTVLVNDVEVKTLTVAF